MSNNASPPVDENAKHERTFQHALEVWIGPEIQRRITAGTAVAPVLLIAFQVIFHPEGDRAPTVRINEEIKAEAIATVRPETIGPNGELYAESIIDISGLRISDDPNCGHVTFIQLGGMRWFGAFSAIYNVERVSAVLPTAREFLAAARLARAAQLWAPCVDNLHSAVELAAKADLWLTGLAANFTPKMDHRPIRKKFRQWASWGNVPAEVRETFEEVVLLRNPVRYVLEQVEPRWEDADRWIEHVDSLLIHVEDTVSSVRTPRQSVRDVG